ncbi:hypothetical protein MKD41_11520 [Lutibacter sp. A64]|uniref:hypothetical protein n=1 Tax=Lutibacter sp. A64 TaxID=2918526 RepID=UPI001F06B386|nr:hypothetical protein [Lutibacter sp. A64]UMB52961.1 hypothetical protein MKD41_11520 [Lutibacter sp. A64]
MNKETQSSSHKEVLFVVDQVPENKPTNNSNYHYFHNQITRRPTNKKVIYKNDLYIIETDKFKIEEIESLNFKLILVESKQIANQLNTLYRTQAYKEYKFHKDIYSISKNYKIRKMIIHLNNFNKLSKQQIFELVSDIHFISIDFSPENDNTTFFDRNGAFGNNQLIYYQYTCTNCNDFNLKIINKSEPKPNKCKYCNELIVDSEGNLRIEVSVLENNKFRTVTDKL